LTMANPRPEPDSLTSGRRQVGDVGVVLHHKDHCGGRSVEFAHRLHRPTPAVGFGSSLDSPHDDRMMIL
ncbi:MAG: hypothetical protein OSA09_02890, partial [Acidimicrobiales bacterium]|nr:hypothetical protein [Acidimicrobiales bacterium]